MTPQQEQKLNELLEWKGSLESSSTIPLNIEQSFRDRLVATSALALVVASGGTGATTLTGILKGNGTSAVTAIVPLAGTKVYYVADTSGGAVTRKLTFTDGVLTAET